MKRNVIGYTIFLTSEKILYNQSEAWYDLVRMIPTLSCL